MHTLESCIPSPRQGRPTPRAPIANWSPEFPPVLQLAAPWADSSSEGGSSWRVGSRQRWRNSDRDDTPESEEGPSFMVVNALRSPGSQHSPAAPSSPPLTAAAAEARALLRALLLDGSRAGDGALPNPADLSDRDVAQLLRVVTFEKWYQVRLAAGAPAHRGRSPRSRGAASGKTGSSGGGAAAKPRVSSHSGSRTAPGGAKRSGGGGGGGAARRRSNASGAGAAAAGASPAPPQSPAAAPAPGDGFSAWEDVIEAPASSGAAGASMFGARGRFHLDLSATSRRPASPTPDDIRSFREFLQTGWEISRGAEPAAAAAAAAATVAGAFSAHAAAAAAGVDSVATSVGGAAASVGGGVQRIPSDAGAFAGASFGAFAGAGSGGGALPRVPSLGGNIGSVGGSIGGGGEGHTVHRTPRAAPSRGVSFVAMMQTEGPPALPAIRGGFLRCGATRACLRRSPDRDRSRPPQPLRQPLRPR